MKSRSFLAALAAMSACAGSSWAQNGPEGVILPLTEVNLLDTSMGSKVKNVATPFGRSLTRSADYVVAGDEWREGRLTNRAPSILTDMDLSTRAASDYRMPGEVAVMFARGFKEMGAGPDVFVMTAPGESPSLLIAPVYRMPDGSIVEGEAVAFGNDDAGVVNTGQSDVAGLGIDLDGWANQGMSPAGALLIGAVLRPADGDPASMAAMDILLGEGEANSETRSRPPNPASNGGGFGGGGAGGANPGARPASTAEEIPAPSSILGLGLVTLAALRRRRH